MNFQTGAFNRLYVSCVASKMGANRTIKSFRVSRPLEVGRERGVGPERNPEAAFSEKEIRIPFLLLPFPLYISVKVARL